MKIARVEHPILWRRLTVGLIRVILELEDKAADLRDDLMQFKMRRVDAYKVEVLLTFCVIGSVMYSLVLAKKIPSISEDCSRFTLQL